MSDSIFIKDNTKKIYWTNNKNMNKDLLDSYAYCISTLENFKSIFNNTKINTSDKILININK
jgi:hypothetical protein